MFSRMLFGDLLPIGAPILFGVCLVISAIGFWRTVYFISIGYGFSIAAMVVVSLSAAAAHASPAAWIVGALLVVYGVRLGVYLARREAKASYRRTVDADGDRNRPIGIGVSVAIWITVSLLYVAMMMPLVARLSAESRGMRGDAPWLAWAGAAIMALGILVETVADRQKSLAKERAPNRFCDIGLYRVVRCPKYFGELLVWTGNLVAGAALLENWLQWTLAAVGYLAIFLVMKGSARRLELKQGDRYGADPEYQAYVKRVPILFPLVPIYSFRNAKVYLG